MSKIAQIRHCHICHLPFLASLYLAIFDVQTSYGCLKVSEFYQESDSEDKNHLRQFLQYENKLLGFCEFLPCNPQKSPQTTFTI